MDLETYEVNMLGLFNFVFLQWFGLRLAKVSHDDGHETLSVLGPVLPISGWFGLGYVGNSTVWWT